MTNSSRRSLLTGLSIAGCAIAAVLVIFGLAWRTPNPRADVAGAAPLHRPSPDDHLQVRSVLDISPHVTFATDFVVLPTVIGVADQNSPKSPRLVFLDRRTGLVAATFSRENTPASHLRSPVRLFPDATLPTRVWVLDSGHSAVYAVDADAGVRLTEHWYKIPLHEPVDSRPVWIDRDLLAVSSITARNFVHIFRVPSSGRELLRHASGGFLRHTNGPSDAAAAHLNRVTLSAIPGTQELVTAYRHSSVLHYYDAQLRLRTAVTGPVPVDPEYKPVRGVRPAAPNAFFHPHTRWTYVDTAVASGLVYCLFSGHTWRGPPRIYLAKDIHVYDERGRLVRMSEVPEYVYSIDIDARKPALYALRQDPAAVLEFDLPTNMTRNRQASGDTLAEGSQRD